jgi:hypothetical protein
MKPSAGLILASVSMLALGGFFFLTAYVSLDGALPIIDTLESVAKIGLAVVFLVVGCWAVAAMVGVLYLRTWARTAAIWLGVAVPVAYLLLIGWYGYGVMTTPDVGWSWEAVQPLPLILGLAVWWLVLSSRTIGSVNL